MKTKKMLYLSMIVSIGIALHIIESSIPMPFIAPGAKLGLANIVNLITLVVFGYKYAFAVAIIRCLVATLGTGAITGLLYSLSGALLSTLVMWVIYRNFSKYFSLIGVSVFGALAHNIAQLTVASMMIQNGLIFTYLPVMMLVSLFTGYFVGLTSNYATVHLRTILSKNSNSSKIIN